MARPTRALVHHEALVRHFRHRLQGLFVRVERLSQQGRLGGGGHELRVAQWCQEVDALQGLLQGDHVGPSAHDLREPPPGDAGILGKVRQIGDVEGQNLETRGSELLNPGAKPGNA